MGPEYGLGVPDHGAALGAIEDSQRDAANEHRATKPFVLRKRCGLVYLEQEVGSKPLDRDRLASGRAEGGERRRGDKVDRAGVQVRRSVLALERPSGRRDLGHERVELGAAGARRAPIGERNHRLAAVKVAAVVQQARDPAEAASRLARRDPAVGIDERPETVAVQTRRFAVTLCSRSPASDLTG
jgi:hypothetical protein